MYHIATIELLNCWEGSKLLLIWVVGRDQVRSWLRVHAWLHAITGVLKILITSDKSQLSFVTIDKTFGN